MGATLLLGAGWQQDMLGSHSRVLDELYQWPEFPPRNLGTLSLTGGSHTDKSLFAQAV